MNAALPQIILDTDMSGDVDDAGALAVLHKLADFGECGILACVVNGRDEDKACAATIHAVNDWYGRLGIPIGTYQGTKGEATKSKYTSGVRDAFAMRIKHRPKAIDLPAIESALAPDDRCPRALDIFRQVLAAAPDASVTVVSIGFLMNLRDLLESNADCLSDLAGTELIRRKVVRMVMMGGQFPASDPERGEYNFAFSEAGPDTQFVIENWPTPILFTGFEIGEHIWTGRTLPQTPPENPVRLAFDLYHNCEGRQSFDQTAVLAAVRPPETYWNIVGPGRCIAAPDGTNTWSDKSQGHSYLVARESNEKMAGLIDELMTKAPIKSSG